MSFNLPLSFLLFYLFLYLFFSHSSSLSLFFWLSLWDEILNGWLRQKLKNASFWVVNSANLFVWGKQWISKEGEEGNDRNAQYIPLPERWMVESKNHDLSMSFNLPVSFLLFYLFLCLFFSHSSSLSLFFWLSLRDENLNGWLRQKPI